MALADITTTHCCLQKVFFSQSRPLSLSPFGLFLFVVLQFTVCMSVISHIRCSVTDPGKTPGLRVPDDLNIEDTNICLVCEQYKPPRSHHCRVCSVCIHRMDHHCLWTNNCVGLNNHKFFLLFLFYIGEACTLAIALIGLCAFQYFITQTIQLAFYELLFLSLTMLQSIIFLVYTLDFLSEQVRLIKNNQTTVESYKRQYGKKRPVGKLFQEVFGENTWAWAIPIRPVLSVNYYEPMYNYSDWVRMPNARFLLT